MNLKLLRKEMKEMGFITKLISSIEYTEQRKTIFRTAQKLEPTQSKRGEQQEPKLVFIAVGHAIQKINF